MKACHLFPFIVFVLLLSVGCGDKQKLGGRVTFTDDGSPIEACTIIFDAGSHVAQGNVIKPDGTYVVGSTGLNDGIPYGEYRVYITGGQTVTEGKNGESIYTSEIDPKYRQAETSGLTFIADGKKKTFDIQLDRIPGGGKK